ncbi:hypothetical protein bcgnr5406_41510 [Bacillus cereus]
MASLLIIAPIKNNPTADPTVIKNRFAKREVNGSTNKHSPFFTNDMLILFYKLLKLNKQMKDLHFFVCSRPIYRFQKNILIKNGFNYIGFVRKIMYNYNIYYTIGGKVCIY